MTENHTPPIYAPQYTVIHNCLYEIRSNRQGTYERKLCNFTPRLVSEILVDDGLETSTRIRLSGTHESGRTLPEIEITAEELPTFNWLMKRWGMDCILEVGSSIKDSVRYAIQSTARYANRQTVYAVTGWRKINGRWQFLMSGNADISVSLPGKMQGYAMASEYEQMDILTAAGMFDQLVAPKEIVYPLLAITFLSPLNHFLKKAGCEPKFVLFLVGKTGSRKSTLAALMLSFFGRFTASELPLSFRDTANSIIHNAFALKDVLTCIDDFHPSGRQQEVKLTETAQSIMRAYGDRTGKGRLRADSTPMESRPPQGNAIITAEFPPDIGESGTARYFALEIQESDVDLPNLSAFQREAADGTLQKCMLAYLNWLRDCFLYDDTAEKKLVSSLGQKFTAYRDAFRSSGILCHGRVPETVAWLRLGMDFLLQFLMDHRAISEARSVYIQEEFQSILCRLALKQAANIIQDKPSHKFIRKLYALIESKQVTILPRHHHSDFIPMNFIGYEDSVFYYLQKDAAHRAVRKLCEEQGESFTITVSALLKNLAEEKLIVCDGSKNTKKLNLGTSSPRLVHLRKDAAQRIADEVL